MSKENLSSSINQTTNTSCQTTRAFGLVRIILLGAGRGRRFRRLQGLHHVLCTSAAGGSEEDVVGAMKHVSDVRLRLPKGQWSLTKRQARHPPRSANILQPSLHCYRGWIWAICCNFSFLTGV